MAGTHGDVWHASARERRERRCAGRRRSAVRCDPTRRVRDLDTTRGPWVLRVNCETSSQRGSRASSVHSRAGHTNSPDVKTNGSVSRGDVFAILWHKQPEPASVRLLRTWFPVSTGADSLPETEGTGDQDDVELPICSLSSHGPFCQMPHLVTFRRSA